MEGLLINYRTAVNIRDTLKFIKFFTIEYISLL